MKRCLKTKISRWWAISVLASVLAVSSIVLSSSPTLAATCNPGVPLDGTSGPVSCTMAIGATIGAGEFILANDASARVSNSPFTLSGTNITAGFNFTSVVEDHRGTTSGWTLQAASSGITNGTTTFALGLTSLNGTSSCTSGTCSAVTFTSVNPLTTTAATFLTAGNTGHTIVVDGDYTNVIDGQFIIPAGSPAGNYTGIITISLLNTF